MNQFSTFQPTSARFNHEKQTWHCPLCRAVLASVETWANGTSGLIVADAFSRDSEGVYQKPKKARPGFIWSKTQPGRDYAAKLQSVIEQAEANARRWESLAQATNANSEEAEAPNGPDAQARYCHHWAQSLRITLDSLGRSRKPDTPETQRQQARRELLEKHGYKSPTTQEREQRAAQAWTDPKEFTAAQISAQQLMFLCCGRLHPVRRLREIA